MPDRYSSNERIVDLLLSFADAPAARQSMAALARRFRLSRSSTYRYLQILRIRGLIAETEVPGEYELGPALALLGELSKRRADIGTLAAPILDELQATTRESVLLTQRHGDHVVVVATRECRQMVRIALEPARRLPLYQGSPAKVHLAYLGPPDITRAFQAARDAGSAAAKDPDALTSALAQIRRRGYAESEGEIESGVSSVSLPVFGPAGEMLAGLTVAGPSFRLRKADRRRMLEALKAAAQRLGESIVNTGAARREAPRAQGASR